MEISDKFYERAKVLGHNVDELKAGKTVSSSVKLHSIDDLRNMLMKLHTAEENAHFRTQISKRITKDKTEFESKVESYTYGGSDLSADEKAKANEHFPIHIQATSATTKSLPSGQTLVGPNLAPQLWNYDTIVFASGAFVDVQSTYFTITATTITIN